MARTGRVAGCYEGRRAGMRRKYDPFQLCTECGMPAAWRQTKCHDCLCEASVDYMPDEATIRAECEAIQREWGDVKAHRAGEPELGYEIPVVHMAEFR